MTFIGYIGSMRFVLMRYVALLHDLIIAGTAFLSAYVTAFGFQQALQVPGLAEKTTAFVLICAVSFLALSVNRGSWRYVSIPDLVIIIKAVVIAVVIYTVGAFLLTRGDNVPRSVPVLSVLFLIAGLSGSRLTYRLLVEKSFGLAPVAARKAGARRYVLLCGLSDTAESFIRSCRREGQNEFVIVGILDEAPIHHSRVIQGVKVLGALSDLERLLAKLTKAGIAPSELIVTEKAPSRRRLNEIVETGTTAGLKVARIPEATETASVTDMLEPKPIELGDLLERPEVDADLEGVARLINGRKVLVTGAGGSIGSELCRQIALFAPSRLIITDSSEFQLYTMDAELRALHPALALTTRIVDVRDRSRVASLFKEERPEAVFHAAALKHVPIVEENPVEGIKTNLLGTCNVANAAVDSEVAIFIMISTDKAVNPTNVMGATKRAAEAYCQALDLASKTTRFKTVRFGNVLGSNGSVVPRFRAQIASGGPITVTHPHIVRYFMTIPEAVRLVLHASSQGLKRQKERGKIVVLDMGKPVRIVDLAERMIQLAGYRPRIDIDIVFTGLRPGEKLYEELFDPSEVQNERTEEGYVVASPRVMDRTFLNKSLVELEAAVAREDAERALGLLRHLVPEYTRNREQEVPDFATESGWDQSRS